MSIRVHPWLKFPAFSASLLLCVSALNSPSATVVGNLTDISLSPLNTKLIFTPTNEVQIGGAGLIAGPPKILDTTAGAFSITLDTGDYTVTLPAIPYRRPFLISVFATNGAINITNIISALPVYPTNNPNWTVKSTPADNGPGTLNTKIHVAGSLSKILSTNSGAITLTLSNSATASALDNANVHIGTDGTCGFALLGTPFHINASGNFDRLSIGDGGEHTFSSDGSFGLANGNVTSDANGNLSAHTFTTSGDIEITDTAKGLILKSPGGTRYRIKIADDGTLSTEIVP